MDQAPFSVRSPRWEVVRVVGALKAVLLCTEVVPELPEVPAAADLKTTAVEVRREGRPSNPPAVPEVLVTRAETARPAIPYRITPAAAVAVPVQRAVVPVLSKAVGPVTAVSGFSFLSFPRWV
jgi:hypothetical protein